MRLNRILQLAASFSILIFAMVFTITSCSGDDGKNGKNGADGKSCEAHENAEKTGYELSCGDEYVGTIWHGTNSDGSVGGQQNCILAAAGEGVAGAVYTIKCGDTKIPVYGPSTPGTTVGGGCTVKQFDKYNPFELGIVCEVPSDTVWVCSGKSYSKSEYVCTNGKQRTQDYWQNFYNCGSATAPSNTSACSGITYHGNDIINGGGVLLDVTQFKCGTALVPYNPNKYFCQPSTSGASAPAAGDAVVPLCGSTDYNDLTHFCFKGSNDYQDVVVRCGAGLRSFLFNEFCPVVRDASSAPGSTNYGKPGLYNTAAAATATATMPQLCGGKQYGTVSVDGTTFEIKSVSYTGGEYFASSAPAGVARLLNPVVTNRFYYEYGSEVCDGGVVKTKCAKAGSADTLLFDASLQFCRTSKDDVNKIEIANLCFKTGTTTGGTKYDDVNYFCDPETGLPSKKCASENDFYDESQFFCYGGRTKAPYCKDDDAAQRVYDPDLNFCSYQWTGKYVTVNSVLTPDVKEKATPFCNNTKGTTFNVGAWKWEYCVGPGATTDVDYNSTTRYTPAGGLPSLIDGDGTGAPTKVLSCLLNQVPATPGAVNSVCMCYYQNTVTETSGYLMHPGTGQCTVITSAGNPSTSTAPGNSCPGGATFNSATGSCTCPVNYPTWSSTVANADGGSCMSAQGCALKNATNAQEYWDYNAVTPACAATCSGGVVASGATCPKQCTLGTEVADWDGTCKTGTTVAACSAPNTAAAGAVLGGAGNVCSCAANYTISTGVCVGNTNSCGYGLVADVTGTCAASCTLNSQLTGTAQTNGTCACDATHPEHPAGTSAFGCLADATTACTSLGGAVSGSTCACDASIGYGNWGTAACKQANNCDYPLVWDSVAATPTCVATASCTNGAGATNGVCN